MWWVLPAVLVLVIIGVTRLEWLYSATRDHVAALERRLEALERQLQATNPRSAG